MRAFKVPSASNVRAILEEGEIDQACGENTPHAQLFRLQRLFKSALSQYPVPALTEDRLREAGIVSVPGFFEVEFLVDCLRSLGYSIETKTIKGEDGAVKLAWLIE